MNETYAPQYEDPRKDLKASKQDICYNKSV